MSSDLYYLFEYMIVTLL